LAGQQFDVEVGSWFGPQTISNVLNLLMADFKCKLCIYTAENGVVYKESLLQAFKEKDASACLTLIPLRLGVEKLNPLYYPALLVRFMRNHRDVLIWSIVQE
jgi:cysteine protease ATG4